jgi:hypothetical protein
MTIVARTAANRLGLDYEREAARFQSLPYPIIDTHSHIHGARASIIYGRAAKLYGVGMTYSMTPYRQLDVVKRNLGDAVRFIAMPSFMSKDPIKANRDTFIKQLPTFYRKGARIVKFWSAPRGIDYGHKVGDPDLLRINAPHRIEIMKAARDMGFIFMAHVGDPDTWFATKYKNASRYHTKRWHYEQFEEVLSRFEVPWIGAHMGGWPEDLGFLSDLLARYPHLYLDASATKWMVRELSQHSVADLHAFLERWRGRIMFGSDIISSDDHLRKASGRSPMGSKASSEHEAFDLYASRYWALRKLWETDYDGESPIADPDLHLVDPTKHTEMDAPPLKGKSLPADLLRVLYHDAAHALLEPLYRQ